MSVHVKFISKVLGYGSIYTDEYAPVSHVKYQGTLFHIGF